jgi:putative membrane protein
MSTTRNRVVALRPALLSLVIASVGIACSDRDRATGPTAAPPANTAAPGATVPPPPDAAAAAAALSAASVAVADRDFVSRAVSNGMLEIEASQLALERSKSNEVRAFAQRMVDEHKKAHDQLKAAASSGGIKHLPPTMLVTHNAHLDFLRTQNGLAFDREYAAQIGVAAHTEALTVFERAAQDAASSELRTYAEKSLPMLQDHLKQAQSLAKAVGVPADRMKAAASGESASGRATSMTGMEAGKAAGGASRSSK